METPSVKKRLGEFLILLIYLLIEGFGVWPINHLVCLVSFVAGLPALLLMDGAFPLSAILKITGMVGFVCSVIYFTAAPILPVETESHGWLIPANEPTPPNGCGRFADSTGRLLLIAGRNAAWSSGPGTHVTLVLDNIAAFAIEQKDGHLAFDAEVHDTTGDLVARFEQGEFHLIPGKYSYVKRSDDRSKVTAYNKAGDELLYVDFANPKAVVIRGLFTTSQGKIVISDMDIRGVESGNTTSENCTSDSGPMRFSEYGSSL